ncbi:MAG: hypothetical protein C4539_07365 [Ignavibacteriales bacterium]|nr:MAG: hypothetical protein C4539_07365 [Ignavibacteriales bacterium]
MKLTIITYILLLLNQINGQDNYLDYHQDVRGENIFYFSVNHRLPAFKFILIGDSSYNNIIEIIIYKNSDSKPLQNISIEEFIEPPIKGTEYFTTCDFNFDGYKDIMLLKFCGATGNRIYQAWLFNPSKMQFEFNKFLETIYSPEFDYDKKIFTTIGKSGYGEYSYSTYKYVKEEFIIINEKNRYWDEKKRCFIEEIYKRKNGEMKIESHREIKE